MNTVQLINATIGFSENLFLVIVLWINVCLCLFCTTKNCTNLLSYPESEWFHATEKLVDLFRKGFF